MSETPETIISRPVARPLEGCLRVPGDKSVSHRSLMFSAIATGRSRIRGLLEGEDCLATANAMRALGVEITREGAGDWHVVGRGLRGLEAPAAPLDLGNSGTGMRLLCGLMAAQPFSSTLVGDASLSTRPMRRVINPLSAMGARIDSDDGHAPLVIHAAETLEGIDYDMPIASAQLKSALLIAGLYASSPTVLHEPAPSRDHTERMLSAMGAEVRREGSTVRIAPCERLEAVGIRVPADLSSAAFFLVAASIVPGSELTLEAVGTNPTRRGVLDILEAMGADLSLSNPQTVGGEPVADLTVRGRKLKGARIPESLVPLAIDEFPVLFVAAASADGVSEFSGLAELRHKESDRIGVMVAGLRALGIQVDEGEDWVRIEGGQPTGGAIDSHGDHRIAMAFAVGASVASGPVTISKAREIATSFPNFLELAGAAGLNVGPVA
ncbi:MAG: 3-phosphoshikimate 1-carboxyvinyltransferase [Pseudomonadota bacterium]